MRDTLAEMALAAVAWTVQALAVFLLFLVAQVVLRRPSRAVGRYDSRRYGLPH